MKFPAKKNYRKRINKEEGVLNSRTSAFLITSGVLLAAFGIADDGMVRLILSLLGVVFTFTWTICTWQSYSVIRDLKRDYHKVHRLDYLEDITQRAIFKAGWSRPDFLIDRVLPIMFLLTWLLLFILHLLKLLRLLILI